MQIVEWPHEALTTRANEVEVFDDTLAYFTERMHDTMKAANGIGLAANQVADLRRIIVVEIPGEGKHTLINPVIISKKGKITFREGCLSFPGLYEYISDRAAEIAVVAKDATGKELLLEAKGLLAVCIQHEIDHLDGKVFLDRMSRLKKQMAMKQLSK